MARAPKSHEPIEAPEDDKLQRIKLVRHVAEDIREIDTSAGYVIAITGPWGSGKTSLVNLVRKELEVGPEGIEVLDFNPWMFSGSEQLVQVFFNELAAQLRLKRGRLEKLADDFNMYGDLLSPLSAVPFIGAWFDRIRGVGKTVKQYKDNRKQSAIERRRVLANRLTELEYPILVVVDDIDRLDTSEIRDIFKLVRLTASFPNVIYLLAFDRERVEGALDDLGLNGRSFLAKIIQHSIDVPVIPERVMFQQIAEELSAALDGVLSENVLDQDRWTDIFPDILRPLIHNMRDARRYAHSARAAVRSLNGQIEMADVLALEAIRVFLPDTFGLIGSSQNALTDTGSGVLGGGTDAASIRNEKAIRDLLDSAGSSRNEVENLIRRIFPAAEKHVGGMNYYGLDWQKKWIQSRRVAHPAMLRLYLERVVNEDVEAFNDAGHAFRLLDDESGLNNFLKSLDSDRQLEVIEALETYEESYPESAIVPCATVLLNLLPSLPEPKSVSILAIRAETIVKRVLLRLFNRLSSTKDVEDAVARIWSSVPSLHSRLILILLVGDIEDAGHKLVSHKVGVEYEGKLEQEISSSTPELLAGERGVLRLLLWVRRRDKEASIALSDGQIRCGSLVRAIVLDSIDSRRSRVDGNRAVRVKKTLPWDLLAELFGGKENLAKSIAAMNDFSDEDTRLAMELVEEYLCGRDPEEF